MRILIIEDNQSQAELVAFHVEALGWTPVIAGNLAAGIGLLHADHFDLVLLDFGLPDSVGNMETVIRVCWAATPSTPLVAISETENRDDLLYFIRRTGGSILRKRHLDAKELEWAFLKASARLRGIHEHVAEEVLLAKRVSGPVDLKPVVEGVV